LTDDVNNNAFVCEATVFFVPYVLEFIMYVRYHVCLNLR